MSAEPHGAPWPGASDDLWWACSAPERPTDPYILWNPGCHACQVKAEITVAAGGPGVDVLARIMGTIEGDADAR